MDKYSNLGAILITGLIINMIFYGIQTGKKQNSKNGSKVLGWKKMM